MPLFGVSRKLGISKWPFRDRYRFNSDKNSSPIDTQCNIDYSKAVHQFTDTRNHRCSDVFPELKDSSSPSEDHCGLEADQDCHSAATTPICSRNTSKPSTTTILGLHHSSALWAQPHENHLDGGEFPLEEVEEVDEASSPSDGGAMSGSDAERLDCANASDESSLLLGSGSDGDAELDGDDMDLLLRIAPDARWYPHAAACGGGGGEAMRDHELEWGSLAASGEQGGGGRASGEHEGGRPDEGGDDGRNCDGEVIAACAACAARNRCARTSSRWLILATL